MSEVMQRLNKCRANGVASPQSPVASRMVGGLETGDWGLETF
jgi:hypothetical protein